MFGSTLSRPTIRRPTVGDIHRPSPRPERLAQLAYDGDIIEQLRFHPALFENKVAFVWKVADKLRGTFKQHEYGSVMLPQADHPPPVNGHEHDVSVADQTCLLSSEGLLDRMYMAGASMETIDPLTPRLRARFQW